MKKILIVFFLLTFVPSSFAQEQGRFNKEQNFLLNIAKDYLAKIKSFKANFIQVNPGTTLMSSGVIMVSKPGRLKMSYTEPFRIDYLISDDDILQYDYDLDEVTRGLAPENPLKILLYDDVSLTNNELMDVTNLEEDAQTFSIYMVNRASEIRDVSGMILKFRKNPLEIMSIQRVDNEGNKTETNLTSVEINKKLDDTEFIFKRPKAAFPNSSKVID